MKPASPPVMATKTTTGALVNNKPLYMTCQCLAVSVPTPAPRPSAIYHCHCIECRRQSASAFGTSAVFPAEPLFPLAPDLQAQLAQYNRPRDAGGVLACYFCKTCGTRLFHRATDADGKAQDAIFVKAGCVLDLDLTGCCHIFTRSAVVPIPDDAVQYAEMPPDGV